MTLSPRGQRLFNAIQAQHEYTLHKRAYRTWKRITRESTHQRALFHKFARQERRRMRRALRNVRKLL